ncbi:ABC transporter ATP-binding protein [Actinomyces wuliandei]|uniref:ABC transporter ATP-binding protein n=1 Tax=Actinomyces wuliandei TaxID=2057743 RepID=UPI00111A2F54|nr:ABC transporter ATP-binding protein [Actinomyces wuliandei]
MRSSTPPPGRLQPCLAHRPTSGSTRRASAPAASLDSFLSPPLPDDADGRQGARRQVALQAEGLVKAFGSKVAVDHLDLEVPVGSFYGIVGPNGAGKTTMLSMATGLLRPDAGRVHVHDVDVWADLPAAKAHLGVLPDGLRTFDRLNGLELVTYSGLLRGLDRDVVVPRATELIQVLGLWEAGTTMVADYSAGMRKKVHLACAMVHSPSILVLDEPFEAVDPISAQTIQTILRSFAEAGGTVVVSSHVMATVERLCDHVAIINAGRVAAAGTTEEVAAGGTLEERFTQLVGAEVRTEGLSWLQPSSR